VIVHSQEPGSFYAELYGDKLLEYRQKFPAHMDADDFELRF